MKQSHTTTPRTLADCSFTTGHRCVRLRDRRGEVFYFVVVIACMICIGVMLAWRG